MDISKDKKAITNYSLSHVPTIKIYDNSQCLLEECSPFNNQYLDIIEKYYENPEKYAFSFQMMAYISRLAILKESIKKNPNAIFITERSLYTDKYVFAKMLFDSGNIELVNYKIYLSWFDTFAEEFPVSKVIYVNTEPEICHQRIEKRSRTGETNIPLEYLQNCHKYHTNMLDTNSVECICKDQLILNGNRF